MGPEDVTVVFGAHDLMHGQSLKMQAREIIPHPRYNWDNWVFRISVRMRIKPMYLGQKL